MGAGLSLFSGCALKEPLPSGEAAESSHLTVPFVPPRSDRCASSALEMVAGYWQENGNYQPLLSPQELDRRTLIPEKKGTLQIELVAATRAEGLVAYPLKPSLDALLEELSAENPVIVLVNRAYSWYPLWHYATVTGYDAEHEKIFSHFSDIPDEPIAIATFSSIWNRSDRWGIVPVPPDHIPVTAEPREWLKAAYDLETTGRLDTASIAYESGVRRWPEHIPLLFALANARYREGRLDEAEKRYREILDQEPDHPYALNNLADLLCRKGRGKEALKLLERKPFTDDAAESLIEKTRSEIRAGCPSHP